MPKAGCLWSNIHRPLLAAEVGQRADILTYSSGHLGPHSLNQSQPHKEKKSFWSMSRSLKETTNPWKVQQTKALTSVKKKEVKESPSEFSTGTTVESEVSRSRRAQATNPLSHSSKRKNISFPKKVYCSSDSLSVQPRVFSQKKSNSPPDSEGKQHFCSSHSNQEGLQNEGQLKTKKQFGRQIIAKQDHWAGINVAEMHEKKLQEELRKLSVQSWPGRDRLVVFSDVFDDVCEDSPVFGRILREIKTAYDLYINHLMASQSSLHDMSPSASLEALGNSKVREPELEDDENEICRLEQEASRALEESKRVQNETQNVPAVLGLEDSDVKRLQDRETAISYTDSVQSKRLQVLNTWREIQQLEEEEIKEKLVSSATTTATERCIKDLKTEIMRLIASNDRLKTTNKDLEENINMVLNREKASKAMRRMLWEEILGDLQPESK